MTRVLPKAVRLLSSVLLGMSVTADAADPLNKYLVAPQAANTTLGYENVDQRHTIRELNGERIDLQPLFAWINRGRINRGGKPFDQPCPLPKWRPIDGTVIKVMQGDVLVAKGISRSPVIIKNIPASLLVREGATLAVMAAEAGSFELPSKDGLKDRIPVYDHGVPIQAPVPVMTNSVNAKALPKSVDPLRNAAPRPR